MNEEDEQSLLGFVREAAANARKNGSEPMPVPIGQIRHVLKEWATSLTGASVSRRRPTSAVSFATKYLGMPQQIEADVEPLSATAVRTMIVTDAIATADATIAEIADEIEKLLQTKVQALADQVKDLSVAARPSVDPRETDNAFAPSQEEMTPVEGIAGQGEHFAVDDDMPSPTEIGLFGAVPFPAEHVEPKFLKNAGEISELILEGLRQAEGFPERGVDLTVYGFGAYWNAMMTFAPGATTVARASIYRKVLPLLVVELRKRFELA